MKEDVGEGLVLDELKSWKQNYVMKCESHLISRLEEESTAQYALEALQACWVTVSQALI